MSTTIWIIVGAVALLVVLWRVLAPSLDRSVARAVREGDTAPLIKELLTLPHSAQHDAFNHAIRRLWDDYQRELAVPLIRALVEEHTECKIAQYWLDQLQGVEPELARSSLGVGFIQTHYKPHLAATCGEAG